MGRGSELANRKHAVPEFPSPTGSARDGGDPWLCARVCVCSTHEAPQLLGSRLCTDDLQYVGALLPGYREILDAPDPLPPAPAVAVIRPHIARGVS